METVPPHSYTSLRNHLPLSSNSTRQQIEEISQNSTPHPLMSVYAPLLRGSNQPFILIKKLLRNMKLLVAVTHCDSEAVRSMLGHKASRNYEAQIVNRDL